MIQTTVNSCMAKILVLHGVFLNKPVKILSQRFYKFLIVYVQRFINFFNRP